MAKVKTSFFCQNCGAQSPKWVGKCPSCQQWNTYVEEIVERVPKTATPFSSSTTRRASKAHSLSAIEQRSERRMELNDPELHRVLGGGVVPGSLILFGGEPGIGKSTLLLQAAIAERDKKVLYISGEESETQIKMRADRLGGRHDHCFVLTETNLQNIVIQLETVQPDVLIIDSIQTMHTQSLEASPGSISQIKACTAAFLQYAKASGTPVFLVGHITKEGALAGPKVLEHMVDTVLLFEGDRHHVYRIVRAVKNRFGSTHEIGIYEMQGNGLRAVEHPSEMLMTHCEEDLSGVSIAATIEGIRPLLVEVQALVSTAAYGTPQRSSTGFDLRRLHMLLAVLEKRCAFKLGAKDVFLNIAGGIKVHDPAIDLAVVCAVMSSNANLPISGKVGLSAELSLSGEVRPVNRIEQRISEAQRMGVERMIISKYNKEMTPKNGGLEVIKVGRVEEAIQSVFG